MWNWTHWFLKILIWHNWWLDASVETGRFKARKVNSRLIRLVLCISNITILLFVHMISLATTVMDTSVPALLPEWLKNGGSVPTSGSASHHYHCSLVIMGYSRFVIFVIFRFDCIWRIEIKKEHLKLRFVIYV